jgi:uncharacterized Zn finger protein
MKVPGLTTSYVHDHAAEGSYDRGETYQREGAVVSLKRTSETTIDALVKGSQYAPYNIRIRHDDKVVTSVECSCPYFAGAWCKHVVAALLACLEETDASPLPQGASHLVDRLDKEDVGRLLDRVARNHPEIVAWIRAEIDRSPI